MDDVKQQLVDRLKQSNNILVTVRNSPNVDLLCACIGLALVLDKMDKHAAAVFSGEVPSTIEFLKPEATIERSPDSLRDFIIALDKSKADKLRYKVEDKVVRIFITPYKTSLSEKDLEFSQGDFNVDAVVALGAHEQQELDQAIIQHGRILHDATILSINNTPNGNLGSINWQDIGASSVCELVAQLVKDLGKDLLDEQIATALLAGIVAETDRFSNEKTTPRTMSLAGDLMSAGANQQLVATALQQNQQMVRSGTVSSTRQGVSVVEEPKTESKKVDDGTLEIEHLRSAPVPKTESKKRPEPQIEEALPKGAAPGREMLPSPEPPITNVHGAPLGDRQQAESFRDDEQPPVERSYLVEEPTIPTNTPKVPGPGPEPSSTNPFDVLPSESVAPLLARDRPASSGLSSVTTPLSLPSSSLPEPSQPPAIVGSPQLQTPLTSGLVPALTPAQPVLSSPPTEDHETLEEIEQSVHSPHLGSDSEPQDLAAARNEVLAALKQGTEPLEPLASLNASPLGGTLHTDATSTGTVPAPTSGGLDVEVDSEGNLKQTPTEATPNLSQPMDMPLPQVSTVPSAAFPPPPVPQPSSPNPPPPMPPPMMPPSFMNSGQ